MKYDLAYIANDADDLADKLLKKLTDGFSENIDSGDFSAKDCIDALCENVIPRALELLKRNESEKDATSDEATDFVNNQLNLVGSLFLMREIAKRYSSPEIN